MADSTLKIAILAVDKASKTMGKVGGAVEKMGVAGAVAAGAIAAFGVSSVKAYSEAEAAQAKLQDTFDKFPRLADVSIESLRDYNGELQKKTRFDDDAIASGQAILGQYEITGKQLQELTPLIADFAAKTGQSFEDASAAVGKGLLGSGKAFKQIGLDFEDAGSQTANFEQIMSGLRTQVGGFAETEALTGAGAAERLKNQFGELQETVGAQLLPPLTELAGIASDVLVKFNELPGPVKNVTGGIVLLSTAALVAAPRIAATATALAAVNTSAVIAAAPLAIIAGIIGGMAYEWADTSAAIDGGTEAIENFRAEITPSSLNEARASIQRMTEELDELRTTGNLLTQSATGWRYILGQGNAYEELATRIADAKIATSDLEFAIRGLTLQTGVEKSAVEELTVEMWDSSKSFDENKDAILEAVEAKYKGTASAAKLAEAELEAADAAATAADKTRAYKDALDALNNPSLTVRDTQRGLEAAYDAATDSIKENGRTLDISTPKGRANADALDAVAQAAQRAAGAQREKDGNDKRANETLRIARDRLVKQAEATGMSREAARKYVDQVLKIPKSRSTKVTVNTKAAEKQISEFVKVSNGKTIIIDAKVRTEGQEFQGRAPGNGVSGARALGGPVLRGKTYLVGERGPELFTASSNGMIIPNGGSGRGVAGGLTVIVQTGQALATETDIGRAVVKALDTAASRGIRPRVA